MDPNEYFKPWITGDTKAQFKVGFEEGRRDALNGVGWPDGSLEKTDYGRGYIEGRKSVEGQNDKV